MSLRLQSIVVGESGVPWEAAGFTVVDGVVHLGAVSVVCAGDQGGDSRWVLAGAGELATVDGISVVAGGQTVPAHVAVLDDRSGTPEPAGSDPAYGTGVGDGRGTPEAQRPPQDIPHRNRVIDLDHVVLRSPDLERTTAMFENQGVECRRIRDVPLGDVPMQQRFFRIATGVADSDTSTILELVGPAAPTEGGPATIWGLACVVDDINAAVAALGDVCSEARDAVQPGRKIATVRTRELGIGLTLALMTPR